MRVVLPLAALFLATAAAPAPEPEPERVLPENGATMGRVIGLEENARCLDRVEEVRGEPGKHTPDSAKPSSDPLLIFAVEKQIDGCSVMVMRNDVNDMRPLPGPSEHRLMPAR